MARALLSNIPDSFKSQSVWRRRILFEMTLLTFVCAFGALGFLKALLHLRGSLSLENEVRALGERLNVTIFNKQPLGTTRTMGLASKSIKNLLLDNSDSALREVSNLLDRVRAEFEAAIVCLVDLDGAIKVCSPQPNDPRELTGRPSFKACFKSAVRGVDIMYPSLEMSVSERGICYASPVLEESSGRIIGVVGMKMSLERLDAVLGEIDDPVAVVSPLGVVFAANRPEWLFHRVFEADRAALRLAQENSEAAAALADPAVPSLPFRLDSSRVMLQDRHYAVATIRMPLSDASGSWRLMLLRDTGPWMPLWLTFSTVIGILLVGSGVTLSILSRGRDRLEQARSRRLLEESEARWRAILESVHAAIITVDAQSHVIEDVNPAALRMLGQERSEIVGRICHGFICTAPLGHCPVTDEGRKSIDSEESVLLGKGRRIPVLKTVAPVRLDGRERLLHSFVDISALKRAQEQVSIFRRCVEASGQGFGMATLDGEITYVNPTMWSLLGIERQEDVQGEPFVKFYPREQVPRFYKEILPAIMRQGMWTGEMLLAARGGSTIPTIDHFFLIRDEQGHPHRLGFAITDISEQTKAAENLERARKDAEEANRAKSDFLANMSHEIRTPMNAIIGMTDLALETDLDREQRDYLQTVKISAGSLLRLLNDILDFSKIEAGKLDLSPIAFDLHDCIQDTMRTLGGRADQKGIELTCRIGGDVPNTIEGDPGRLRQILINLVGNAIKFTEVGEVAVSVMKELETEDTMDLHFVVRDTGIGVPKDKRERIFESFAQADGSTTRSYGGTGLGLAISKQLVELMDGRIWVESPVRPDASESRTERSGIGGPGSAFRFTVRMGKRPQAEEVYKASAEELRNLPVLIVDDNATNRRVLIEMLSNWRMRPTAVSNGDEAVRVVLAAVKENRPFRVILLDGKMPDVDGYTLAVKLREIITKNTSMMMLTSAGKRGDAARCRELGIEGYLLKPVRQSELLDGILNLVARIEHDQEQPLITRHWLRSQTQPLKILLAEDNPVNQKLAVSILTKRGHDVEVVSNGRDAIARLSENDYDLVLMDVQMPEMDGLTATREIRNPESSVKRHDIPIIAMTAHAMEGDRQRCLDSGMNDYVSKPIETEVLLSTIEQTLAGGRGRAAGKQVEVGKQGEAFDEAAIMRNVDGDKELLTEIVGVYLDSYPDMLAAVRNAVEAQDAAALERAAHTLKGSVGAFGARKAAGAALALENIGRDNRLDTAQESYRQLERELERLRIALKRLIEGE